MQIGEREIAGNEVEIHADAAVGVFEVRQGNASLGRASTLDSAISQARVKLAKTKVKVAVPFWTFAGEQGVAHGLHAGNGDVLCTLDGKAERLSDYSRRRVLKADTPPEVRQKLQDIMAGEDDLAKARREIENKHAFDIGSAVRTEVEKAAQEAALEQSAAGM